MAADLSVSRKTISQLLTESLNDNKVSKFVIPDYQRPYKWDEEKCETLWRDIKDFHVETKNTKHEEYFLGTIVTYIDINDGGIDVIDGQQRLTSFFLLLRAFYTKLEEQFAIHPNDKEIDGLMKAIGQCIWDVNRMSKEVTDKSAIHIESKVATDKEKYIFHEILQNGKPVQSNEVGGNSNYAINYRFFLRCCEEYAAQSPMDWKELCLCILERCIVLPIECKDFDSSLTIFSTLNDRGMALDDSDIFKAQIYKNQDTDKEKETFTTQWRELSEYVEDAHISLNDIFRYYSHIIKARNKDNSKEVGLRKFYAGRDNKYSLLKATDIMSDLINLAQFWISINKFEDTYCTLESKQYLHCLNCYPNEYWKFPLSVFFQYYKDKDDVDKIKEKLPNYLKKVLAFVLIKFIEKPTVNAIKDPIFNAYIETYEKGDTNLSCPIDEIWESRFDSSSSSKITKPILLLNSYLYDKNQLLIAHNFQIEHIFPQNWDKAYFTWSAEDAGRYLNMYGNKIPFERRLNIQASNGFFSMKQDLYAKSEISEAKALSEIHPSEWSEKNIETRNLEINIRVKNFIKEALSIAPDLQSERLLQYDAKNLSYIVGKITQEDIVSYVYYKIDNDSQTKSDVYSCVTFLEAFDKIDEGLKKYITPSFVDNSIQEYLN